MLPRPKTLGADTVFYLDVAITGAFTLELLTNVFAHSRHMCTNCLFFRDKNNWFDGCIVAISISSVLYIYVCMYICIYVCVYIGWLYHGHLHDLSAIYISLCFPLTVIISLCAPVFLPPLSLSLSHPHVCRTRALSLSVLHARTRGGQLWPTGSVGAGHRVSRR